MAKLTKIFIIIVVVIIVVTLLGTVGLKFWARGGRLTEDQSRELVLNAWAQPVIVEYDTHGIPRMVEYRIGDRNYLVKPDYTNYPKLPVIESILKNLFPQVPYEDADEFLDTVDILHAGRTRVAGFTVERIALKPSGYTGHSIELWVGAENNLLLGWRKLDENGELVRGWRFRRLSKHNMPLIALENVSTVTDDIVGSDFFGDSRLFDDRTLIPERQLRELAETGRILLPEWQPDGFSIAGGRWVHGMGPQNELEQFAPGLGLGRMRLGAGGGGGGAGMGAGGQFQVVYTDGLNTISLTLMPNQRIGQAFGDPQRVNQILADKGAEIRRLFHTSMAARVFPGRLVLAFGGVEEGILRRMVDSIPFDPLEMGIPELGPDGRPDQPRLFPPDGERRPGDRFPDRRPGGGPPGGGRIPDRDR